MSIRGVEELEGLKEMIISDRPAINCVERLQRLPSEVTTMVGRSGCERLQFNADEIGDTVSMADAFCEIELKGNSNVWTRRKEVKETIHSFHKTHHLLSAFIVCALLDSNVQSHILYGTRTVPLSWTRSGAPEWVYISVVTEERLSEYASSEMLPTECIEKAFIMGVKAGEEWKNAFFACTL